MARVNDGSDVIVDDKTKTSFRVMITTTSMAAVGAFTLAGVVNSYQRANDSQFSKITNAIERQGEAIGRLETSLEANTRDHVSRAEMEAVMENRDLKLRLTLQKQGIILPNDDPRQK